MEDQMKNRLYRLRREIKTCDDWQVKVLQEEINDLVEYLDWRKKSYKEAI